LTLGVFGEILFRKDRCLDLWLLKFLQKIFIGKF
jgi:hypothetical protein